MSKMKQATLTSLKGVVVVEDFTRYKNALDNQDETEENVIQILNSLKEKKPGKEVISSTGIDKTLQALENHPNKKIAAEVAELIQMWNLIGSGKRQPTVEVRYDNLTRHIRRTSVRLFTEALGGHETDEQCADILEREIFHKCNKFITKSYKRTVRKIVFTLRHQEKKRKALRKSEFTHLQFVAEHFCP
ncbi:transcription elongation factor A N-terminal and central domain-containing protein 2-like [Argiope bruennichi]|uniref:transcription elongation factor A N-terminal and central domain-containing protein 2-like n=1 Tax=Argiope bruennichi TaxID=94029 RepID=UPI0024955F25|nr:transcription elongation factor A N-terminal and central domain-containing protein 2-like [Argiope bruennichi]XP_055934094.1 transcription elongation factor A N-terminal and central domain-containing protein 2-like [Argiope bruennichi]XP_055934095.1 transcription elongation factor A N-terminal and central domain-containing protein 2-like [Argiope bruennichi]XP_055934096.1 transcription elongation factor A N-terminal and central domain-containing protein 2-like [Argiope bruennichi]